MKRYNVTGMSCAACSARVEKAVSKVPGVDSCAVNLLTNSMIIEGTADPFTVISAVEKAGYGASEARAPGQGRGGAGSGARPSTGTGASTGATANVAHSAASGAGRRTGTETGTGGGQGVGPGVGSDRGVYAGASGGGSAYEEDALFKDTETPRLRKRLIASIIVLAVLMYFSMGHMMWGWPVPGFFEGNHMAMGLLQLILTSIIMLINQKFFISGFRGLLHRAPNMDTLVALGAGAAFVYSTYALFAMTYEYTRSDVAGAAAYMHELYFESAAMILTLITVGKMLEARSKGKTTDALKSLMRLAPKTAVILVDGRETEVDARDVRTGDIFVLRPGESVPVDGIVVEGMSAVDESVLTGESVPADKGPDDRVFAATINKSGFLKCEAVGVGEDTALARIIQMVSDASATKAPIAKVADKVSGIFVPAVIAIAVVTFICWMAAGETLGFALARGISVLVISCPCALGLATPVAVMVGSGKGAKDGILFKTAGSLEETGKINIAALDKTGTVTKGEPRVTDITTAGGVSEEELMKTAYSLEVKSEHPLARAIVAAAEERTVEAEEVTGFEVKPGNGLEGTIGQTRVTGGSMAFVEGRCALSDEIKRKAERFAGEGKTPLFFEKDGKLLGMITVADIIKENAREAVEQLHGMGIKVVMITGDNERTARAIGRQAGVDDVISQVLPEGKETAIRALQREGRVAMVGDGINDAPALTRADIGIAIGAGTDVAIDAADVVLMNSDMMDVPAAVRLSRLTLRNIHQNLFWAFIYNTIGIPLAAGVLIPLLGIGLNPMFAAAAMSLSSFCVVTNALTLNMFDIRNTKRDRKKRHRIERHSRDNEKTVKTISPVMEKEGEMMNMEKTMKIEGMMCQHCEATVKKALEQLDGVSEAAVSHENGTAVVTMSGDVTDDVLKKAVEDKDYKVLSIA